MYIAANKLLYFAFIDLEKAFDYVPRKVIWWALRSLGVKERAVSVIQGIYSNARVLCVSMVSTVRSSAWELALFLAHCSSSWCWRQLCVSSAQVCLGGFFTWMTWCSSWTPRKSVSLKLKEWKSGMESRGLCVNMKETKFLVSGHRHDVLKKSGKYPFAVCFRGGGNNYIRSSQCMLTVLSGTHLVVSPEVEDMTNMCVECL